MVEREYRQKIEKLNKGIIEAHSRLEDAENILEMGCGMRIGQSDTSTLECQAWNRKTNMNSDSESIGKDCFNQLKR